MGEFIWEVGREKGRQSVTAFELFFDFIKQLLKLPQLEQQIVDYTLLTQNQAGSQMNFVL